MHDLLHRIDERPFLTDGGLETTLIFLDGIELPHFASIAMLRTVDSRDHLKRYFERYIAIARNAGAGFILEAATWRAGPDWAEPLGLEIGELDDLNRDAVAMLHELRAENQSEALPILISGCMGPRGDGYIAGRTMLAEEAEDYHGHQIAVFAAAGVDLITALTMTNVPEAIGIAKAARRAGLLVVISFTLETDGRLPTGDTLKDAIEAVDAATGRAPAYYMINCAHPSHFATILVDAGEWIKRVRGLRANASCLSHAELDETTELDPGDPAELAQSYAELKGLLPGLCVFGGCCGTDDRHVAAIADTCATRAE